MVEPTRVRVLDPDPYGRGLPRLSGDEAWRDAEKNIDMALVMLDSGVARESTYHITRALGSVTTIGQRAMTYLKDEGLL